MVPSRSRGNDAAFAADKGYVKAGTVPSVDTACSSSSSARILSDFKSSLLTQQPSTTRFSNLANINRDTSTSIQLQGYLGTRRVANKSLIFAELHDEDLEHIIQLVSSPTTLNDSAHATLRNLDTNTPVLISGTLKPREAPRSATKSLITSVEVKLESILPLNTIAPAPLPPCGPEDRHLQIRTSPKLREALKFRSAASQLIRNHLTKQSFIEYETPILFKSTPEGAREFLVPTRNQNKAYALPQSPQQYKQILMASGVSRYFQIARCFRDEDLRADRQPEFTQVDLEMGFADAEDVKAVTEGLVRALWEELLGVSLPQKFERMTYHEAMTRFGSDKPDVRFGAEIKPVGQLLPPECVAKLSRLAEPVVEGFSLRLEDASRAKEFVDRFMKTEAEIKGDQPGVFFFSPRQPVNGLAALGFEAADAIEQFFGLEEGDILILQARPDRWFDGSGTTQLGSLRSGMIRFAVRNEYLVNPNGFDVRWITDFPLFTPTADGGLSSTHHPFTSPKTAEDVDRLLTDPLAVTADHYDLVVNGVELGGGSKRIHNAAMQELILKEVLCLPEQTRAHFDHLIKVLGSGCPPHAGIALGFDRLLTVMLSRTSVKHVMAFPKGNRGEDVLVGSPGQVTPDEWRTYHLKPV
ncbi:hypothetical protein K470DRAFT_282878 [Piedraia hortae CBS 480.64]|uniref:Aminoacyl-transfer RNA synthetases class-II family profile domain-containing protein n=1 Tax=Piedraia hortae CBS 480.64 TaxID=1314780 RepID=A0A6A7BUM4_9PEZI|nr:hypothetical protein K470DRAFT_282878 [Piedraia hortae CBS 480.64]